MTEIQIDQKLCHMDKYLWVRSIYVCFRKAINEAINFPIEQSLKFIRWFWGEVGGCAGLMAASAGVVIGWFGIIWVGIVTGLSKNDWLIIFAVIFIFSILLMFFYYINLEFLKTRELRIWEWFCEVFSSRYSVSEEARKKYKEIAEIYSSAWEARLLSVNQSARLLNIYYSGHERVVEVDCRLGNVKYLSSSIRECLVNLRNLNERNITGELSLEELKKAEQELSEIRSRLKQSQENVDAIISRAKNELKARKLHQELDNLSQVALKTSLSTSDSELIIDNAVRDLEEDIKSEIDLYLELETSTRRYLEDIRIA